jgi:hypothetical protein
MLHENLEEVLLRLLHSRVHHILHHVPTVDPVDDQTIDSLSLAVSELLLNDSGQHINLGLQLLQNLLKSIEWLYVRQIVHILLHGLTLS